MIDFSKARALVKDLRICCSENACDGCTRDTEYRGCDHLERDAADMIESLLEYIEQPKVLGVAIYDQEEIHHNCTVQILSNSVTGDVSVGWWPNQEEET